MKSREKRLEGPRGLDRVTFILGILSLIVLAAFAVLAVWRMRFEEEKKNILIDAFALDRGVNVCTRLLDGRERCTNEYEGISVEEAENMVQEDGLWDRVVTIDGESQIVHKPGAPFVNLRVVNDIVVNAEFSFWDGNERMIYTNFN